MSFISLYYYNYIQLTGNNGYSLVKNINENERKIEHVEYVYVS
jgi:hypothetical protein